MIDIASGVELPIRPLADMTPADVAGAHVIHLAFLGKDKTAQLDDAAFRQTNRAIDDAVLAALGAKRPASVFVASSGAAMLAETGRDTNPYGLAKLEQEARFARFAAETGVPVLCGRIFNVAGPHINKLQNYAISNFALQALAGCPIKIGAAQPVFRSFLHVEDLSRIVLLAARGRVGKPLPIDLCGEEVLELQDIAGLVAAAIGESTEIERPVVNTSSKSDYVGRSADTLALAKELKVALQSSQRQVHDTVDWLIARNEFAFGRIEAA